MDEVPHFKYVVFDADGRLTQINHVYDRKGYPDVLHDNKVNFLEVESVRDIDHELHYALKKNGKAGLYKRPEIVASVSKYKVKANNSDVCLIGNLPKKSKVSIIRNGVYMPGHVDLDMGNDTEIEFTAAQPGSYTVTVNRWPYRKWSVTVEAVG